MSFRTVNRQKGKPFLSFRLIPILVVLGAGLAIQPAAQAGSPVARTLLLDAPNPILFRVLSLKAALSMSLTPKVIGSSLLVPPKIRSKVVGQPIVVGGKPLQIAIADILGTLTFQMPAAAPSRCFAAD